MGSMKYILRTIVLGEELDKQPKTSAHKDVYHNIAYNFKKLETTYMPLKKVTYGSWIVYDTMLVYYWWHVTTLTLKELCNVLSENML